MKTRDLLLIPAALFAAITTLSAAEVSEDTNYSIGDVVVTASGTPRLLKNTPETVQVITAADIQRTDAVLLNEALEKLTSSITTHTNGMGTYVNLNGVGDDYFIFLENGRKIGGDNIFSRIDLSRVKRIEIMSGAAATLYGSNAIGGVVNIITYDPDEESGVSASSSTSYNGYGRLSQSVNLDVKGGKLTSQTSYRYQKSDSWQLSDQSLSSKGVYSETTDDAFDGYASNLLNQTLYYNVNDKLELSAYGSFYDNMGDRTYDYHKYNLHHENYGYGAGMKYKMSENSLLVADFTSDNYTSSYVYFKESGDYVYGDEVLNKRSYYHNADVKGIFNLGKINRLTAGVEYTLDTHHDPSEDFIYNRVNSAGAYAQDELSFTDNLQATVGLRYTYNEIFNSNITQNASLLYSICNFRFRATYATGYLAPSQSDLYTATYTSSKETYSRNNEDLNPEESVYFSFGTEYSNKWAFISATVFHNKINDMIGYRELDLSEATAEEMAAYPEMEVLNERYNISRAEVFGVNVNAKAYLGAGFSLKANYTYLDSFDFDTRETIDKGVEHTAIFNANWVKTWNDYMLDVSINGQYNSAMYSAYYSGTQGDIPSYTLWDLTTSHQFKLQNGVVVEPVVGVQNIFNYTDDRPINSYYATLTPGRSLYLALNLRF